LRTLVNRKISS